MPRVLVVADVSWVLNEVQAALTSSDMELVEHNDPATAADEAAGGDYDAVVVDLQVGAMGGMALTRAVREVGSLGRGPDVPVVMLLDRKADVFLAKRAGAAAWVVKPFTSHSLASAIATATERVQEPT